MKRHKFVPFQKFVNCILLFLCLTQFVPVFKNQASDNAVSKGEKEELRSPNVELMAFNSLAQRWSIISLLFL